MDLNHLINERTRGYIASPLQLQNKILQNRLVFQPMEGCDGSDDGSISELTRRRYLRFAKSGTGLIWFEAVAVANDGRANPRQLFLNDKTKESFSTLLKEIRQISISMYGFSPIIIMQATHSGRQSNFGINSYQTITHHNAFLEEIKPLKANYKIVTSVECKLIEDCYVQSAILAKEVGFDGIDIKNCHGYLFNEFLSSYDRTDEYGGSLENRSRLYLNCITKVQAAVKDMIITTRLGVYDGFAYPYGFGIKENCGIQIDLSEAKEIICKLQTLGVQLINITIGNPYVNPHINRPYNTKIENGMVGIERMAKVISELQHSFKTMAFVLSAPTYLKELSMNYCENMLKANNCTLVGFGRMTFAYPNFYQDYLQNGEIDKNKCCTMCSSCSAIMRNGGSAGCTIRDSEIYMPYYKQYVLNGGKV